MSQKVGPLAGLRVVEFSGIGPAPHCVMLMADLGAEVLRIARKGGSEVFNPVLDRGRCRLELDLRSEEDREAAIGIVAKADILVESFRPGVMERLGLGPAEMCDLNPRLIYGRMTGWGQSGPLARTAGHDINYIALTGALAAVTDGSRPIPPINLVGDFGGGSLYLALGILAALWERESSGQGQVIDAAIVDGVASLMAIFGGLSPAGGEVLRPDRNPVGGQAPFYRCYECEDGKYLSIGPLEPHFYEQLLEKIGASPDLLDRQNAPDTWTEDSQSLAAIFRRKTRDAWCSILEGSDACFAPVLTYDEAADHPHMKARDVYLDKDGSRHVAPAPRFSRTPGRISVAGDGETLRRSWLGSTAASNLRDRT